MYVKCQLNSLKKEIEHVHINNEKGKLISKHEFSYRKE